MKVLVLPSWYPDDEKKLNGIFFKEQVESLYDENVDIMVLAIYLMNIRGICGKGNKKKGLYVTKENGVTIYRYYTFNYFPKLTELYLRYYSKIVNKLIKQIEKDKGKVDLVHIHSAIDAGIAYNMSNIGIPYIITEHSSKYQRNLLNDVQKKYLYSTFKNADRVIAVGKGLREAVKSYCPSKEVLVIPNMVSFPTTAIHNKDLNKRRFRFFSLGLLTRVKGMDLLIEAFNKNRDQLQGCELLIGGDGEEKSKLQSKIEEYNLQEYIKLLGMLDRNQVSYNMNNCDAFILASRFETFGIVFLEAMTYGKPVIGTKTGGPDTFINKKNGIIVDVEDVEGLSKAMIYMANNTSRYDENYIKNYCDEKFSKKVICNKIIDIYNEVCEK